jgi:hypothetical protein
MNNPDQISEKNKFFGLKYLHYDADRGSGKEKFGSGTWDGKHSDPGYGINIPNPQH